MSHWTNRKNCFFATILLLFACFNTSPAFSWTRSIDFEGGTVGAVAKGGGTRGFDEAGTQTTIASSPVHGGSRSAKFHHQANVQDFATAMGMVNYPQAVSNEIWARMYVYLQPGYNFGCYGGSCSGTKFFRIHTAGSSPGYITLNLGDWGSSEIVIENELQDKRVHSGVNFDVGAWQCIEVYVKFSSSAGITRVWKNGDLIINDTSSRTTRGGAADFSYFRSYWNDNPPATQDDWFDDIVLTTDTPSGRDAKGYPMIGPIGGGGGGGGDVPPNAPKSLRILQ